jgi:hypothetical protein
LKFAGYKSSDPSWFYYVSVIFHRDVPQSDQTGWDMVYKSCADNLRLAFQKPTQYQISFSASTGTSDTEQSILKSQTDKLTSYTAIFGKGKSPAFSCDLKAIN